MDLTSIGGIVAGIGLLASIVGTVVGAKVAVELLQRAHERFEDAVWKAIDKERDKTAAIIERVAKVEAICKERSAETCGP